ncbi:hypothetical protein DN618_07460 [Aeromonas caviae]|nr:hypothetical protein DN618_07460 [Aeromonas caviae]
MLLCCCAAVLLCCCAAVLLCCCAAVLLCCCAALSLSPWHPGSEAWITRWAMPAHWLSRRRGDQWFR